MQAKVYESRLQKLENEQDNFNIMKQRITAVKFRLKEIVQPHENHCRCRTELKLRPPPPPPTTYTSTTYNTIQICYCQS